MTSVGPLNRGTGAPGMDSSNNAAIARQFQLGLLNASEKDEGKKWDEQFSQSLWIAITSGRLVAINDQSLEEQHHDKSVA